MKLSHFASPEAVVAALSSILLGKNKSLTAIALLFVSLSVPNDILAKTDVIVVGGIQIKEVLIPMKDGVRLAADLYAPVKMKKNERLPVILEYLPYRKDENRPGRLGSFDYFINHGYIVARVDIRGTGRSEGKLVDGEYSEQEQLDGVQVIDWLSKQNFSNGNIAMIGISWGGFNGLHLAMRHPPALKTIISCMSTDDLYQDDVHYIDGMHHIDTYELGMDLSNTIPGPPDFDIGGDYFKNRFETEPWILKYKKQQADGPFWDRASLNRDYSLIDIPVFLVGGYYDGYRDIVPRMVQNADVPYIALLGPWNHTFPHNADPEPAIEWREMAVRWLDHWLKGEDTGILEEPSIYYYQRDWHEPGENLKNIPGRWYTSDRWPETKESILYLNQDHDLVATPAEFKHSLIYNVTAPDATGVAMWWGDWFPDQRASDAHSLVYDSEPITDSVEIMGIPQVTLQTSTDAPAANWFARLSDVAPNGMVTHITGAGFNGNHVESPEKPIRLIKDKIYTIQIDLHVTSWTFQEGHKIRIAINNSQWPTIWPSPYAMTTTIRSNDKGKSFLKLPVLTNPTPLAKPFPKPEAAPKLDGYGTIAAGTPSGYAELEEAVRDESTGTTSVLSTNSGSDKYPWGIHHYTQSLTHIASDEEPANSGVRSTYTISVEQEGRILKWTGILDFSSDEKTFFYQYKRVLEKNGEVIKEKEWVEDIPRLW
jgi:predicted acyl esterase